MESKEIQKVENQLIQSYHLSEEDIRTLVDANIIPEDAPQGIIKLFARFCAEKNLSPFTRQIHLIPRFSSELNRMQYTIQIAIDGLRSLAERTNKYAGTDDYLFDEGLTLYEMVKAGRQKPVTATAIVYKILPNGNIHPIRASARWEEYYPGEGKKSFMWRKMPFLMLGKCAEALALRKAFPDIASGLYTDEEMQQADIDVRVEVIDDSTPKKVEVAKDKKVSKETRDRLIKLANHKLFERISEGNTQSDRAILLKIASDPNLTEQRALDLIERCNNAIQQALNEEDKLRNSLAKQIYAKSEDEEFQKIILDMFPDLTPFYNESDLFAELQKYSTEQLEQLKGRLGL
jgi:phage recombination protein Bet